MATRDRNRDDGGITGSRRPVSNLVLRRDTDNKDGGPPRVADDYWDVASDYCR